MKPICCYKWPAVVFINCSLSREKQEMDSNAGKKRSQNEMKNVSLIKIQACRRSKTKDPTRLNLNTGLKY